MKSHPNHLLTGEELTLDDILSLLDLAGDLKKTKKAAPPILAGKNLAMLFDKPSLRTRFSFSIAVHALGGNVIESIGETRKKEDPEDIARVLSGYCDGIIIRTFHDGELGRLAQASSIPVINALSDDHHPCQILADLLTLKEKFGQLEGLKIAYIGDGNNILHSLGLMAPLTGIHLHYCCPKGCEPKAEILKAAKLRATSTNGSITSHSSPHDAVIGAHAVYTDVWTSMGFENNKNEEVFAGFQVDEALMAFALPEAVFMHCMPMAKGKEVNHTLPDSPQSVIFQQSENRLHVQKALLTHLLGEQP